MSVETDASVFDTVIIGDGPAALGCLQNMVQQRRDDPDFLSQKVAIIGDGGHSLRYHRVRANSPYEDFITCLDAEVLDRVDQVIQWPTPPSQILKQSEKDNLPLLTEINELVEATRKALIDLTQEIKLGTHIKARVNTISLVEGNGIEVDFGNGGKTLQAHTGIIATGGQQKLDDRLAHNASVAEKVFLSEDLQRTYHLSNIKSTRGKTLDACLEEEASIGIIGGSHSAFSSANYLLDIGKENIKIFYRRIKVFFKDREEYEQWVAQVPDDWAHLFDYNENTDVDEGKINRWGGIRGEAKDLLLKILTGQEPKVTLQKTENGFRDPHVKKCNAIIQSDGYSPSPIPIYGYQKVSESQAIDNDTLQLIDNHGQRFPNLWGTGIRRSQLSANKQRSREGINIFFQEHAPLIIDQIKRQLQSIL